MRPVSALLALVLCGPPPPARAKVFQVATHAPWHPTPLALEMAEAIAAQGPGPDESAFWHFLDVLHAHDVLGDGRTEQDVYRDLSQRAREALGPAMHGALAGGLLELSIANREFSPRVQMLRQLSVQAYGEATAMPCAWAATSAGPAIIELAEVPAALKKLAAGSGGGGGGAQDAWASAQPPEGRHIYPSSWRVLGSAPVVTVYGSPFTPELSRWMAVLVPAADRGEIVLVLRLSDCGCGDPDACADTRRGNATMNVLGFGVELAVKNTEYKASDENRKKDGNLLAADEEEEEQGVMFARLLRRRPDLQTELQNWQGALQQPDAQVKKDLRAWEMADLGMQASQRILEATDPLQVVQRLTGNFPGLANALARVQLSDDFESQVEHDTQMLHGTQRNTLAFDGAIVGELGGRFASEASDEYGKKATVSKTPLDFFAMLRSLREQAKRTEALVDGVGISRPDVATQRWLRPRQSSGGDAKRYDVRFSGTVWLTNNEDDSDRNKANWQDSVQNVGWMHGRRNLWIKRNLFNAVAVVDPSTDAGLFTLALMEKFRMNGAPARWGAVFVTGGAGGRQERLSTWASETLATGAPASCSAPTEGTEEMDATNASAQANASVARRKAWDKAHASNSYITAKVMHYLTRQRQDEPAIALRFAHELHRQSPQRTDSWQRQEGDHFQGAEMRATPGRKLIRDVFRRLCAETHRSNACKQIWKDEIRDSSAYEADLDAAEAFVTRLGIGQPPVLLVNGVPWSGHRGEVARQTSEAMLAQYDDVWNLVHSGHIHDGAHGPNDIHDTLLSQPEVAKRIAPSGSVGANPATAARLSAMSRPWLASLLNGDSKFHLENGLRYLSPGGKQSSTGATCVKFEQSGGCSATGERESHGDTDCQEYLDPGRSGRCVCDQSGTKHIVPMNCGHAHINCAITCSRVGVAAVTAWAFVDPMSLTGIQLLAMVLNRQMQEREARYAVVLNPPTQQVDTSLVQALRAILDCAAAGGDAATDVQKGLQLLMAQALMHEQRQAGSWASIHATAPFKDILATLSDGAPKQALAACVGPIDGAKGLTARLQQDRLIATVHSALQAGQTALMMNGRWVALPVATDPLLIEDLKALEAQEMAKHSSHALGLLEQTQAWSGLSPADAADRVALVASLLDVRKDALLVLPQGLSSQINTGAAPETAAVQLSGVLNPLSVEAHEAAAAATVLIEALPKMVSVRLALQPDRGIGVLPLDRYYRYLLHARPHFDDSGARLADAVVFQGLPAHPTLTLGLHALGSWLTSSASTPGAHDLDNLVLGSTVLTPADGTQLRAAVNLENLVIEGDCGEESAGTQLYLGSGKEKRVVSILALVCTAHPVPSRRASLLSHRWCPCMRRQEGTVVMATRSYFQLKALPGVFFIHAAEPAKLTNVRKTVVVDSWSNPDQQLALAVKGQPPSVIVSARGAAVRFSGLA
jgi:hypothetical protein